eukprot:CAMPEP_0170467492 /NCGR_PEP_ID=MMETSP0123-20130129/11051_1 /TAXON_ID=182087 /ORGANISM="Favella ehrenbergii, Strain Fehren 1" /LENGTH=62 /DNA_ID=CAMNT_0010733873 /DNA_START=480 /DNA_END=668 /DNA_ORIENTATION=-
MLDDMFVLFSAFMSFSVHNDLYSMSLFIGKLFKIAFQYYIEGFFFQYLDEEIPDYQKPPPVV